jgi:hypothetical protein
MWLAVKPPYYKPTNTDSLLLVWEKKGSPQCQKYFEIRKQDLFSREGKILTDEWMMALNRKDEKVKWRGKPERRMNSLFIKVSLICLSTSRCSIVVSIPACHAGDPGSIPGNGDFLI